jgi:crotonobetainyl-CoA:carnitine CoA-transferase CaiB-like acyl-CoA transferase
MLMADMGAEVVKVENPGSGDPFRKMGPPDGEYSHTFRVLNRNKKSITLNLKKKEGLAVYLRLAAKADVVIESFRPGAAEEFGVGYEATRQANHEIIYCSLTGYGQEGPYKERASHDIHYVALSGILGISGNAEGPPAFPAVSIGGSAGALVSLSAILAALYGRSCGRGGQYIDVAMLDSLITWLPQGGEDFFTGAVVKKGRAPLNGGQACYDVYRTADGEYMALGALEPKFWAEFCRAAECEELIERHSQPDQAALKKEVEDIFSSRTRREWEEIFAHYEACCEPVVSLQEMAVHPQVRARDMVVNNTLGSAIKVKGEEPVTVKWVPSLGQHTRDVLLQAGYTAEEIEKFMQNGVI